MIGIRFSRGVDSVLRRALMAVSSTTFATPNCRRHSGISGAPPRPSANFQSQHAQELDIVLLEERQHPVVEQIRRRDRCLAVIQLGEANLGVGVDEGLLVDAANSF